MRCGLLVVSMLLVACTSEEAAPPDAGPVALPPTGLNGCNAAMTLTADPARDVQESVGPYVFGLGRVCIHLDLRAMTRTYFSVGTDYLPGTATGVSLHVDDPDGAILITGGDLTIGETDPHSWNHAAIELPGATVLDVVVVVGAENVATAISADVLDPLD